ncbi:carboxypeptidase-like regulatory domain-containing protein, partial [Parabacteroides sp.]
MSINSNAQNVTIKIASGNITVGQFLKAIEEQTEYLVVYSNREIETERVANIKAGTNKVTELLSNVFKNTDVKYEFENNYIILSKQSKGTQPSILQQSQKKITGTVSDPNGDPIIGANVVEKGTTNGTITDLDGKFSLSLPANATLLISYIGYTSQEVPIGNQTSVSIQLQESMGKLDEVIVVGYGTQRKSSMTAAVTNVNTKELQNIPRPSIYSALQGRVAGLTINESSGEPDKAASLLIRGLGTIDGGTEPLILIDGSPSGTLSHLSTFDIESISVLKDAAASAIYGARAANGVILVTTKQGRIDDDKPMIQFDSYVGL